MTRLVATVSALALVMLVVDLSLPLGVAGGIPYVVLVLLGWWFGKPSHIHMLATIATVLTIIGYVYSPAGSGSWVVLSNLSLALFAIWVTAFLLSKAKGAERSLRAAHGTLELRVMERTAQLERHESDLIRLAEDLEVARKRAEAASGAKSEFLAAMSHELRTPLNAIIGFSEIMKSETFGSLGDAKYSDYAKDIHSSGQHLLELVNDLLDLSRIEKGVEVLHEEVIDVAVLVQSVQMLTRAGIDSKRAKFRLEMGDYLPQIYADARKLKQILANLLTNALKFTPPGGEVTLQVWCESDSGFVFQIVDTGIGILPDDISKALSQFGQIEGGAQLKNEGSGLGLPLAKAMAELHGGSLEIPSEVKAGTTVTVRLPASRTVELVQDTIIRVVGGAGGASY